MKKYFLYITIIFLEIIFNSCKEQVTQHSVVTPPGEITAAVRFWDSDIVPPRTVSVTLLRFIENVGTESLATKYTGADGVCKFSVDTGSYFLRPNGDNFYVETVTIFCRVTSSNLRPTVIPMVTPRYHLAPDTLKLEVDTTALTTGWSSSYRNIGKYDTLICQFDLSSKPTWLHFKINTNIFAPAKSSLIDLNTEIGITKDTFPYNLLPIILKFPFQNQFGSDTLYISFKLKK